MGYLRRIITDIAEGKGTLQQLDRPHGGAPSGDAGAAGGEAEPADAPDSGSLESGLVDGGDDPNV